MFEGEFQWPTKPQRWNGSRLAYKERPMAGSLSAHTSCRSVQSTEASLMSPYRGNGPEPRRVQSQSSFDRGRFAPFWIAPKKAQRRFAHWKVCSRWSLWGSEAHATHLIGLPAKDAKTLAERELGRALTADEASAVETITIALKGNPLRVLQEVALARLNDHSLTRVAQDLQSSASTEKLAAHVTAPLSNAQRRILSALAIFSGAPVTATMLSELLQIDDAQAILEELEERHLVRTQGYFTQ